VWLDGLLPVYRKSVLTIRSIAYSLQSVVVDGTNTVDAGKQRFTPARDRAVTFVAQFHDLTVSAHDAMFSGAVGSAAKVTMPDGTVRTVRFGPDHTATLRELPRGHYRVDVRAGGMTAGQEVRLSQDRVVDVQVLSRRDLAVVAAFALVIAVGLVLAGRAASRRPARGRPAAAADEEAADEKATDEEATAGPTTEKSAAEGPATEEEGAVT